jgi:MFS family permease
MAALGMCLYALLLALFARETLPKLEKKQEEALVVRERFGGYLEILRDRAFITFMTAYTLVIFCASLVWVLLPVYAKQNFGIQERFYGFIPTTNALMVVFLQLLVTRITKRYPTLPVMTVGAVIYTLSVGSIVIASSFWGFWWSMVILTIGELVLVPTASTYAANLAPFDKRGRYMSIFGLAWRVAIGTAPVIGGLLNDNLGPKYIWYGGILFGLSSVIIFFVLASRAKELDADVNNVSQIP